MPRKKAKKIKEKDLQGFKHFKLLLPALSGLHTAGCLRDRAGNRILHFDQYISLLLLYFFNPLLTSLRSIQAASELRKVQRVLGCSRASLGSLSEAARVFDADLLPELVQELAEQLTPIRRDSDLDSVKGVITLVDGSLLRALPQITEAMWLDDQHRAFGMHTHFELLKGVPVRVDVTSANHSEKAVLAASLQPDRVYVTDGGYAQFALFGQILDIGSSFVCRVRSTSVYDVLEDRPLSAKALEANVLQDREVLFTGKRTGDFNRPLRLVTIKHCPRRGSNQAEELLIATDMLDVPAEIVSLLYRERWNIEIFFRYFKHVLGCRHLLSHSQNGIEIQTYVAIIACLLIALWTGKKPTLRTYEMISFYLSGWADEEELQAHIQKLQTQN